MNRRSLLKLLSAGALTAAGHAVADEGDAPPRPTLADKNARLQAAKARASGSWAPIAQTRSGKVRGSSNNSVNIFKGIPYGASTGGANRFSPPRKPQPWADIRDATQPGNRSPQNSTPGLMPEEAISVSTEPMSEDCLRLNVWTAGLRDAHKRPVMVWLHGGGYSSGSGSNVRYDGSRLARHQDVVVVTLNHRLNVFGHLFLADLAGEEFADSGNVGLLDVIAALEWVRDNIVEFGGDPGNVTLFGESGGGGKVTTLMAMPAAAGLFHRAIAQSGLALRQSTREAATSTATLFLKQLGLQATDVAKLRSLSQAQLLAAFGAIKPPLRFSPVVDGRSLPHHPFEPAAPEISANVPLIVGSNATEITFFADTPLDPIDEATLRSRVKQYTHADDAEAVALIALFRRTRPNLTTEHLYQLIATEFWLGSDVATLAERKAAAGKAPVYVYRFEKETPVRAGKLRSVHTLEIPYVFDNLDVSEAITGTAANRYALARTMSSTWARFALTGNPNTNGVAQWPAYSAKARSVMIFNDVSRLVEDPYREERLALAAIKQRQPQ